MLSVVSDRGCRMVYVVVSRTMKSNVEWQNDELFVHSGQMTGFDPTTTPSWRGSPWLRAGRTLYQIDDDLNFAPGIHHHHRQLPVSSSIPSSVHTHSSSFLTPLFSSSFLLLSVCHIPHFLRYISSHCFLIKLATPVFVRTRHIDNYLCNTSLNIPSARVRSVSCDSRERYHCAGS